MCGILTVISKTNESLDPHACQRALAELSWRGPDFKNSVIWNDRIFFGQTVLSLTGDISRSNGSHLRSRSERYHILFNGEIYNYRELNGSYLRLKGEVTDSEVLVNLHEEKPALEVPRLLDGMYAYVLYDSKAQTIRIGRDPQGEKSLYVFEDEKRIIISSEIKAIRSLVPNLSPDAQTLRDYFHTRHFMFLERTPFKGIRQLRPGHLEVFDLKSMRWSLENSLSIRDWVSAKTMQANESRSIDDLTDELDAIFDQTIKQMIPEGRRFASVVSGGVDSSLISYYLLKHSSPETLIAVNHLGKDLISNDLEKFEKILGRKIEIIDVDIATYSAAIPHCQKFLGTPLGSHSFVGQSIQSNYVRAKGCKALFGGEGADELFGGYSCYLDPQRRGNEGKFSPSLYTGKFDPKIKFSENNAELLDQELMSEWQIALKTYEHVENKEQKIAHAMMYCDFAYQLPAVGMRGADLMSMMWSIETRSLFVRRPIVEFGLNLPMNAKSCTDESVAIGERSKRVLKNLFKRVFTKDLLVEKQGFAGFPNESGVYLGDVRDFLALRFLGIDPKQVAPETLNRETAWKLINTEYFLREQQF